MFAGFVVVSAECRSRLGHDGFCGFVQARIIQQMRSVKMIAMVKQDGSRVVVYNERGARLFSRLGELVGYTASNVSIKEGLHITVYNEKGIRQFSR